MQVITGKKHLGYASGFTLIELVLVIVALSIFSAVALPRFFSFSSDAKVALLNGFSRALNSTIDIQHSIAVINADEGGLKNGYIHNGILFDQGYPVALDFDVPFGNFNSGDGTPEILEAMNIDLNDWAFKEYINGKIDGKLTRQLYITSRKVIDHGAGHEEIKRTQCYVSYDSFLEVAQRPVVTVVTSGC